MSNFLHCIICIVSNFDFEIHKNVYYLIGNEFRNFGPESLLYHYGKSFDGFVVKLTEEEAKTMAGG